MNARYAILILIAPLLAACLPSEPRPMTYPADCYPTVEAALAAGDQEDATCATWTTSRGTLVKGPLWAMGAGDVRS